MTETQPSQPYTDRDDAMDCFSLPLALRAVVQKAGGHVDFDDLCAAMGLPFLFTAAPEESDLSRWLMYGRDAFLVPAGRLFGLTIRDMHPPAAARGLDRAEEFRQHFDASYRPLIQRALEHGQAVLAWRGWPAPFDLHWGLITSACEDGVGFHGRVYASHETDYELVLESPAVQCYVVESITPIAPKRDVVFKMALRHAHTICRTDLSDRLNVLTGERAFEEWHRLAQSDDWTTPESQKYYKQCVRLAHDVRGMFSEAVRIIRSCINNYDAEAREYLEQAAHECRRISQQADDLATRRFAPDASDLSTSDVIQENLCDFESTGSALQFIGRMIELAERYEGIRPLP
jgi:hypothetical protein